MSSLSAALVHGPVCAAQVLAASRLGAYLLVRTDDEAPAVLPVLRPGASELPTAVRLGTDPAPGLAALRVGEPASVGRGLVDLGTMQVRIVRSFRPARVRTVRSRLSAGPLPLHGLVERIGLGPGLTPEADDELAGALLVGAAVGGSQPDLEPHLHRTTTLSAALLRAAAQGYAVPPVVAYVDAVLACDDATADRLRAHVKDLGHTSGPALLRGIDRAALTATHHLVPNTRRVA